MSGGPPFADAIQSGRRALCSAGANAANVRGLPQGDRPEERAGGSRAVHDRRARETGGSRETRDAAESGGHEEEIRERGRVLSRGEGPLRETCRSAAARRGPGSSDPWPGIGRCGPSLRGRQSTGGVSAARAVRALLAAVGADHRDVPLGHADGAPVYIRASRHPTIDVAPGRGMFSLDNGRERRFLTRSTPCAVPR
ncbi:MAG: DUF779 domain-containing protein [Amaricoccus sp.]|uniref:DUF779 domain-containing protein n=1 Tax=Amaricoccus sp. TaxID=1872485 RepID=UPI0039E3FA05